MDLRALLEEEFRRRRERNPKYSLRAFARSMRSHHSTLSRILKRRRRLTAPMTRTLGRRLGLSSADIEEACVHESERTVLDLVDHPRFLPDSCWLAMAAGIPLDRVNIALQSLLRTGRLTMATRSRWTRKGV